VNGIKLLREGKSAADVVKTLTAVDAGREHRQLHVMDATGRTAAHNRQGLHRLVRLDGRRGVLGCGQHAGRARGYPRDRESLRCKQRTAVSAPPDCGPESGRGGGRRQARQQSAALLIYGEEEWPDLDIRVDDHTDPLAELAPSRSREPRALVHFAKLLPSKRDPVGVIDRAELDARVAAMLAEAK
jgi:hypothetical protein